MAWTNNGLIFTDLRQQNPVTEALVAPSVVRLCTLGTTTPVQLYANAAGTTPIGSDPITTGVSIGSPGIDLAGNLYCWVPPGYYTPVIGGVSYPPIQVTPHVDDLAALGGGTTSSGSTLQLKTASGRVVTNSSTLIAVGSATPNDWDLVLNPGDTYRFDGCMYVTSSFAAGVKLQCQASGTGAVLGLVMRGPHVTETGQFDVTKHRDTTITITTNGPQQYGGFASSGLSDSYIEILGGFVSLPASAPAPGALTWKFAQATATAGVTTTLQDLKSCLSVVKVT